MNAPERYERFVVPEGTKNCDCYTRVCYEKDTKFINAPLDTSSACSNFSATEMLCFLDANFLILSCTKSLSGYVQLEGTVLVLCFALLDAVIKLITRQITDRISGYRFDSPIISSRYMQLWLLTAS
ncbi:hypothetical protein HID58_077642 [Brassica napus]|uniref:Uncharacterized protein n=1 Tax=Brassica napus TaxID=3708 RepID=A0ABQ7YQY1_BRANA|nr:hypothetical protein HID58_077642 [Brassica napus]